MAKIIGDYTLLSELGRGSFSTAYLAMHKDHVHNFAVKCIAKEKLKTDHIKKLFNTELMVMRKIKHQNVMKLYEFIETKNNYYLIIKYCNRGDLAKFVEKHGRLSEGRAVFYLMQVMNAFRELHAHKVMHRDVKLENIFLHDETIVVGDLGFAKMGVEETTTVLGTKYTMAPELKNHNPYNAKADLYSIGICYFILLFAQFPLKGSELNGRIEKFVGKNIRFPDSGVSSESMDLIVRLTEPKPDKRLDWVQFFRHPLFAKFYPDSATAEEKDPFRLSVFSEFKKNRNNDEGNPTLSAPENLKIKDPKASPSNEEKEEAELPQRKMTVDAPNDRPFEIAREFFYNEKLKVEFVAMAAKYFQCLAYAEYEFADLLQSAGFMLAKKAVLLIKNSIALCKNKSEGSFINISDEFYEEPKRMIILEDLALDFEIYSQFLSKMEQIYKTFEFAAAINKATNLEGINFVIKNLYSKLLKEFKNMKENELKALLAKFLVHFYCAAVAEKKFEMADVGKCFEWKEFHSDLLNANCASLLKFLVV